MDGCLWAIFRDFFNEVNLKKMDNGGRRRGRKGHQLTVVAGCVADGTTHGAAVAGRSVKVFILGRSLVVQVAGGRRTDRGLVPQPVGRFLRCRRGAGRIPRIQVLPLPGFVLFLLLQVLQDDLAHAGRFQLAQLFLLLAQASERKSVRLFSVLFLTSFNLIKSRPNYFLKFL